MDNSKKALFVKKMGKKRLSLARGGVVRKKMGLGGLLGLEGGAGGTGFSTHPGTSPEELHAAYQDAQAGMWNQRALLENLQAQKGLQKQGDVYGQVQGVVSGQGPNPAQAQLAQATSQNVANQAALMAGQRGAGANVGLLARQAGMQGANTQQQAAGQAATLQAQQSLNALGQAGGLANQMAANQIGQTNANVQAQQAEQNILQGANTANNNIQGQFANTMMQGQQGMIGGLLKGASPIPGLFNEGGEVGHFDFVHKMTKMGLDHHRKMSEGGQVDSSMPVSPQDAQEVAQNYDDGGMITPSVTFANPSNPFEANSQPLVQGGFEAGPNEGAKALQDSFSGKKKEADPMKGAQAIAAPGQTDLPMQTMAADGGEIHPAFKGPHKSHIANYLMSEGGVVPALVSPGEIYLNPQQVNEVVEKGVDPAKIGKKYGGKAKVKGNSPKNDFIPDDLQEGGVVIDREHAMSPEKRIHFVHKSIAKKRVK